MSKVEKEPLIQEFLYRSFDKSAVDTLSTSPFPMGQGVKGPFTCFGKPKPPLPCLGHTLSHILLSNNARAASGARWSGAEFHISGFPRAPCVLRWSHLSSPLLTSPRVLSSDFPRGGTGLIARLLIIDVGPFSGSETRRQTPRFGQGLAGCPAVKYSVGHIDHILGYQEIILRNSGPATGGCF